MTDMLQENLTIEMEGTVTPPPSISDILTYLRDHADRKEALILSAGELRVLINHLEAPS